MRRLTGLLSALSFLAGCCSVAESPPVEAPVRGACPLCVTPAMERNWTLLKVGMSEEEVEGLMGEPSFGWGEGRTRTMIYFGLGYISVNIDTRRVMSVSREGSHEHSAIDGDFPLEGPR